MNIPLLGLLFGVMVFAIAAAIASLQVKTPKDFFHFYRPKGLVVSLLIGNITLGTGLVYYTSFILANGYSIFIAPLGGLIGYFLLAYGVRKSKYSSENSQDLLGYTMSAPQRGLYRNFIKICIPLVYLILISFEIWVSAPLISAMSGLPSAFGSEVHIFVALAIAVIAIVYTVAGGIRGVIATDWFQLAFLVVLILSLALICIAPEWLGFFQSGGYTRAFQTTEIAFNTSWAGLAIAALAFVTAISTQFFNCINLSLGSNLDSAETARVYRLTGGFIFVIIVALITVGGYLPVPEGATGMALSATFEHIAYSTGLMAMLMAFALAVGMLGVLMSTVDSASLAISQMIIDSRGGNTYSDSQVKLRTYRWVTLIIMILPIAFFLYLFKQDAGIVNTLLTLLIPLTLIAPIIGFGLVSAEKGTTVFDNARVAYVIVGLIMAIWVTAFTNALGIFENDISTPISLTVTGTWLLMILIGLIDWSRNRNL